MSNESRSSRAPLGLGGICRLQHIRAHQLLESLELYRGQSKVLFALWKEEGLSHSELAARVHVSAPTLTKMVQRMKRAELLVCHDDPADQRVSRIYLTDRGHAIRSEVDRVWEQLDAEVLVGFTSFERDQLAQYLERIEDNLIAATRGEKIAASPSPGKGSAVATCCTDHIEEG